MTNNGDDHDRPTPVDPIPAFAEDSQEAGGDAAASAVDTGVDAAADTVDDVVPDAASDAGGAAADAVGGLAGARDGSSAASAVVDAAASYGGDAIRDALDRADVPSPVGDALEGVVGAAGRAIGGAVASSGSGRGEEVPERAAGDVGSSAVAAVSEMSDGEETQHVRLTFECGDSEVPWVVTAATYSEGLNVPYTLSLNLATDDDGAEPAALLGSSCTLTVERGEAVCNVSGLVSEVHEEHTEGQRITAGVTVVPALKLLGQACNTRIWQDGTAPEILQAVLEEGLLPYQRDVELRLGRTYPVCEYRTQYDETNLAFCQRLMEEEGIVSWFEQDGSAETLVLADSPEQYGEIESLHGAALEFTEYEGGVGGHENVRNFHVVSQLRPTGIETRHWDWTHPTAPVEGDSSPNEPEPDQTEPPHGARTGHPRVHYEHDLEPLTFSGWNEAWTENDVNDQLRLRREQQVCSTFVARGSSTVLGITAGGIFELMGHPRPELNGRYLVLAASHSFEGSSATNTFTCIPADVPWRPPRVTPKPRIASVQTATVTGPNGEEIHTDPHGRIKVKFHWDRLSMDDETSSCFVRVMQPWAGASWGFAFLPRIGMEVVVTFVNGDPDQPLVVGTVYNGDHATPYVQPDEKSKSTIKTRSTPNSEGYNELTFEDAAGEEQIIVHAQKDYDETVENNHSTTVHANQTNSIDGNHSENVGQDQDLSVSGNRTKTVDGEETNTIGQQRETTVEGLEQDTFNASREVRVTGTDLLEVSDRLTADVGNGRRTTIAAGDEVTVTSGNSITNVDAGQRLVSSSAQMKLVQGDEHFLRLDGLAKLGTTGVVTVTNGATAVEGVPGGTLTLSADSAIKLECGAGSITVKSSGVVEIVGTKIELKAGGSGVKVEPSGSTVSGGTVTVGGGSMVDVAATVVKLN